MEQREEMLEESYRPLYRAARDRGMSEEAAFNFAIGRDGDRALTAEASMRASGLFTDSEIREAAAPRTAELPAVTVATLDAHMRRLGERMPKASKAELLESAVIVNWMGEGYTHDKAKEIATAELTAAREGRGRPRPAVATLVKRIETVHGT